MLKYFIVLFILKGTCTCLHLRKNTDCVLLLDNLINNHPLYLLPGTTDDVLPQNSTSGILLNDGDSIELSCPGSSVGDTSQTTVLAECNDGKFSISGSTVNLEEIACEKKPVNIARYTGKTCFTNINEIEIGFEIDDKRFKRIITVCFDDVLKSPVYSYVDIPNVATAAEANVARPSFVEDSFYELDIKLNTLYTKTSQKATINKQLGLSGSSDQYVSTGNFFLAKGHLVAKADFIYAPQQTATFHYVNAAPQWQGFNSVNWFAAEENARTYAETNNVNLTIYSGIHGILTYPNSDGEDTELYLYNENEQLIPVPEIFWKIMYEPASKAAVVILGVNNPYLEDIENSVICDDISEQLTWLTMDKHKIEAGYTYACTYADLKKAVKYVPNLSVKTTLI